MKTELYLGLDVDKEWMVIAVAQWGRNGPVQETPKQLLQRMQIMADRAQIR